MNRIIPPFLLSLIFIAVGSTLAFGQSDAAHTPPTNSSERKSILDALRGSENVIFTVNFIKVHSGWAWVDVTPLDPKTRQVTAEGGPNLLHLANGKWTAMDLSRVPEDKNDPMGAEDASPTFVRNLRRIYKGCPADIFPKPSN